MSLVLEDKLILLRALAERSILVYHCFKGLVADLKLNYYIYKIFWLRVSKPRISSSID